MIPEEFTLIMTSVHTYEHYPIWIVCSSSAVSLAIYISGFLIIMQVGLWFALLYLLYVLFLEYRLIKDHCLNCYYWGKVCGLGKGKVSAWLFGKGNPATFCTKHFSWKDVVPDLLVSLVPLVVGIVFLIIRFDLLLLLAMALIVLLTTMGNGYIRGKLTCAHCRQREMGCPAEQLFANEKKGKGNDHGRVSISSRA